MGRLTLLDECVIAAMMSDIGEYRKLLRPTVPMRGLFLPAEKFVRVDNGIDCSNPNVSPEWRHHLNESQCQAIGMACTNMFSIVRGPAATGKSETLAYLLCKLHQASRIRRRKRSGVPQPMLVSIRYSYIHSQFGAR